MYNRNKDDLIRYSCLYIVQTSARCFYFNIVLELNRFYEKFKTTLICRYNMKLNIKWENSNKIIEFLSLSYTNNQS